MILRLSVLVLGMFFSLCLSAQDEVEVTDDGLILRERSLNLTGLLNQFIPFGNPTTKIGPVMYAETKIRGQKIRRFGFGANVDPDDDSQTYFHLRFGGGKELTINEKWSYLRGLDVWAFIGNFNVPGEASSNSFFGLDSGIGIAPFFGAKYHISERVNLGTETNLFLGLSSDDGIALRAVPPISLFLSVRFVK